jgi:hypothetical protein
MSQVLKYHAFEHSIAGVGDSIGHQAMPVESFLLSTPWLLWYTQALTPLSRNPKWEALRRFVSRDLGKLFGTERTSGDLQKHTPHYPPKSYQISDRSDLGSNSFGAAKPCPSGLQTTSVHFSNGPTACSYQPTDILKQLLSLRLRLRIRHRKLD